MKNDYDSAKVPMLTVTNGRKSTRNHIFVYSLILALVALSVGLSSLSGPIYWSVAIALNIQLIVSAFKLRDRSEDECVSDNSSWNESFLSFHCSICFSILGPLWWKLKQI